jgi:formylglycine-generating enzyme required for sulfatase activity
MSRVVKRPLDLQSASGAARKRGKREEGRGERADESAIRRSGLLNRLARYAFATKTGSAGASPSQRAIPVFSSLYSHPFSLFPLVALATLVASSVAFAAGQDVAKTEKEMKPYKQAIAGTDVDFEMVPIPGGVFTMGSPTAERGRKPDEGPQNRVKIEPFWMGQREVTWDEYDIWSFNLDIQRRRVLRQQPGPTDAAADAVTRPTKPYTDMTFDMGHDGYPAICMTQLAAKMYCKWLSAKTGHYYRLPTEAEWEYAARGGATTPYWWGKEVGAGHAQCAECGGPENGKTTLSGSFRPNAFGLYDTAGNAAEWVEDCWNPSYRGAPTDGSAWTNGDCSLRVLRGGSFADKALSVRSSARFRYDEDVRYYANGFRVARDVN